MKPCASPLALLLILALAMPALPVRAVAADQCKATAQFDKSFPGYKKICEQAVKDIAEAAGKELQAEQMKANTNFSPTGGQADSAQAAANLSGAAAATQERRAQLADQAAAQYQKADSALKAAAQKLMKDYPSIQNKPQLASQASATIEEMKALREQTLRGIGSSTKSASLYRSGQSQFNQQQQQTQRVADGLKQGDSGVSSGTWVALGGAALIAAGTVGGIAYFGNKGLDKMDKIADQKIDKFEDTAKDLIKEAEDSAKRIIEFASNKASKVLADAEKTVKNIIDQAKKDGEALIEKISKEIEEQFVNLSDTGLEKLRSEMDSVFAEAIAKAKNSGDAALEETLTKARDKTMDKIQKEIDRRAAALPKSSVPNTNTNTATSTSTSSQSSSSTSTTTNSSTATATDSNPVTTTSTSTSTDIRE